MTSRNAAPHELTITSSPQGRDGEIYGHGTALIRRVVEMDVIEPTVEAFLNLSIPYHREIRRDPNRVRNLRAEIRLLSASHRDVSDRLVTEDGDSAMEAGLTVVAAEAGGVSYDGLWQGMWFGFDGLCIDRPGDNYHFEITVYYYPNGPARPAGAWAITRPAVGPPFRCWAAY